MPFSKQQTDKQTLFDSHCLFVAWEKASAKNIHFCCCLATIKNTKINLFACLDHFLLHQNSAPTFVHNSRTFQMFCKWSLHSQNNLFISKPPSFSPRPAFKKKNIIFVLTAWKSSRSLFLCQLLMTCLLSPIVKKFETICFSDVIFVGGFLNWNKVGSRPPYLEQHGSEGSLRHLEDQGANGVNHSALYPVNHFTAHLLP